MRATAKDVEKPRAAENTEASVSDDARRSTDFGARMVTRLPDEDRCGAGSTGASTAGAARTLQPDSKAARAGLERHSYSDATSSGATPSRRRRRRASGGYAKS